MMEKKNNEMNLNFMYLKIYLTLNINLNAIIISQKSTLI